MTDREVEDIIRSNLNLQMNLAGIRGDFEAKLQRTWVGLTDEDAQDVIKKALQSLTDDSNTFKLSGNMIWVAIVKEVEAALRSKNT